MIVNVSPAASSADHTLNTLRYADRIKERTVGSQAAGDPQPAPARAAAREDRPSPLPPPTSAAAQPSVLGRDRNVRNKEISKVLAENIAAPKAAVGSGAADVDAKGRPQFKSPPPSNSASNGSAQRKAGIAGGGSADAKPSRGAVTPDGANEWEDDFDDAHYNANEDLMDDEHSAFHRTVQDVFDEEEDLLNLHMSVIQENAELLTEEGRLLQQIQGENNDIDAYAARLDTILQRKQELIAVLRKKLDHFRASLQREERESQRLVAKGGRY
eukprot:CAMPEP_0176257476 /NCGR_PEP_ID=MMETSP0121_2-20121125/38068_1 /TAXON_ID=160619 /ORGANISM="Kryptoperidinium foliaceum, Strain CCMP 1326" /LENGTH=270 /DNA_ID=CAMNT_0017597319 /DNA_START=63 /DNA_END=876 /DNA_ORIENTATION=-